VVAELLKFLDVSKFFVNYTKVLNRRIEGAIYQQTTNNLFFLNKRRA